MKNKKIKFEGKIEVSEQVHASVLLELLALLHKRGFKIKKCSSKELELVKESKNKPDNEPNEGLEVEIEASDKKFEIEVESENLDLVKELTTELANCLET